MYIYIYIYMYISIYMCADRKHCKMPPRRIHACMQHLPHEGRAT